MDEAMQVAAIRDRLGGAANCSAFISKLWYLMISPDLYAQYIHWSESGDAIVMSNDADLANEFAADVLPKLFKHGNNASFVRQLNLYGFQRISSTRPLDATELKVAKARGINVNGTGHAAASAQTLYGSHSSFTHPRFQRDMETLLPSMKPRSSKKPKRATASAAGAGANGEKGDSDGEDE
ncbi:winged helix DNA-binding domain-containing protein [Tilletiaria anomala UBC 951]|uniref:Winged helix DNA-binding domain-containing protein n=1 Tax=Tilletiaria anomala (strain ATCC 24038 / CBS 436.72 / UBC 951) TaxID=1037660 RepID=A0A066W094_TILAU|nr:winged helix DNA-binding domain-containing protein [Tilletiaria anomala UBC 951]KDN47357.1 winged helix DNA-binding domain-containing protein [Tilletiaria anomala UBC 951]